jgi:probable F420-dependent oxidoreductase
MSRPGVALPGTASPAEAKELARRAEQAGCDALWVLDVRRDPYLMAAAALDATSRLTVGTDVAVAFARSPTVTATLAWDLSVWSGGRFVLGLGSQVGPTLEARFGVSADHVGPRMLDYVSAVRACFRAFAEGSGGYDGAYYKIRRPALQPGGEPEVSPPPIYLAAVNPFMARVAGRCGDGLAAHSFITERYLEEVLRPAFQQGIDDAGGGSRRPVLLQLVVAPDREAAARQMSFYTVPSYRRVLDHAGCGDAADRVIEASNAGQRAQARRIIEETFLDLLSVTTIDRLPAAVRRWSAHCDRLSLGVPWFGLDHGQQMKAAHALLDAVESLDP